MYSTEIHKQAINAYNNGISVKEICTSFSISRSCLYNWIKLFSVKQYTESNAQYTYSLIIELQKQLSKLAQEYKILQQAYDF